MKRIRLSQKGLVALQNFFKGLSQWFPILLAPIAVAGIVLFLIRLYLEAMVKVASYFIVMENVKATPTEAPAKVLRPGMRLSIG